MSTERFHMSVYVGIILRKGNQILLMKRSKSVINGGLYAFPGGGVDGLETLTTATIRESREELGVIIDAKNLKFVHALHVKTEKNVEYVAFFYENTTWLGPPCIMEPDKCDELAWFNLNELPKPMTQTHMQVLTMVDQNKFLSEFGW
jgi:8-oxo-dGTP diphosphatase